MNVRGNIEKLYATRKLVTYLNHNLKEYQYILYREETEMSINGKFALLQHEALFNRLAEYVYRFEKEVCAGQVQD